MEKRDNCGGIKVMPLQADVPLPREPEWELTICLECGRPCWDWELPPGVAVRKKMCSACAGKEEHG